MMMRFLITSLSLYALLFLFFFKKKNNLITNVTKIFTLLFL